MSRGLIIGVVCLAISSTFVSISPAQEEHAEALSLSDRLAALRDKFRRDDSSSESEQQSTSKASRPTYGTSQKRRPPSASTTQSTKRKSLLPSVNPGALLSGSIFGRKETVSDNDQHPQPYDSGTPDYGTSSSSKSVRVATVPKVPKTSRATSQANSNKQAARKSPPTERKNELEAALADLVPAETAPLTDEFAAEVTDSFTAPLQSPATSVPAITAKPAIPSAPSITSLPPTPMPIDGFDLHDALLEEMPGEIVVENTTKDTATVEDAFAADEENFAASEPSIVSSKPATASTETITDLAEPAFAPPSPVEVDSQSSPAPAPFATAPAVVESDNRSFAQQEPHDRFEAAAVEAFSANTKTNQTHKQSPPAVEEQYAVVGDQSTGEDVLFSYQQPVIVSHVAGPRRIIVGREATYQITLENTSGTKAKSLASAISVPNWAEVVDATSTNGVVEKASSDGETDILKWKLSELDPHSSATLHLRLIPRSGRPLQLGVEWSQAPMTTETMVEVQEPKLQIEVSGPQEVLFGKAQRYRLTLSNPGTGRAEKVAIQLIPPGGDAKTATTQQIGSLKAGETRNIDLELTAREAGELTILASATAEGGLQAESTKNILCLKPELEIDWRGPDTKYVGTVAAYYLRVRNPGTAGTEPVTVQVKLPTGSKFVAASDGHLLDSASNTISWRIPSIDAGQEQFMQVRCKVEQPGANTLDVSAQTASSDLSDSKVIQTNVIALADLKLEVSDPQGPISLNESVLYEIRVRNRGTTAAEGVNVVGLFSTGIDPTSVEGAQYTIRDGRVTFHPIQSLPAGREVVLRIRANATHAGTHVFRAEVVCQDLDIKLAAEETTRFFEDEFIWEDGETPYSAERNDSVTR